MAARDSAYTINSKTFHNNNDEEASLPMVEKEPSTRNYIGVKETPINAAESEISAPVTVTPVRKIAFSTNPDAPDAPAQSFMYTPFGRYSAPKPGTVAYTIYLAYQTIGIIYGDIGTSPLYAFTSTMPVPYSEDDVIGVLSCFIWSLLWVVIFKYVIFILFADDHGEGGTFAIYSLLSRGLRDKMPDPVQFRRVNTVLAIIAIIGVSLVMSDGMLTPAVSVLSAIGGIQIAAPWLTNIDIALISAAILFVLFMFQQFGTARVSFTFSPVILLWFIALVGIGIYNITYSPQVFRALSPHYAFLFFINYGYQGWVSLGGIVLVVTGCEALFADLGHFSPNAIRMSASFVVIPALILTYMGQAAALITDIPNMLAYVAATSGSSPSSGSAANIVPVVSNTFYHSIPTPLFYPMLILATLAAIIASQAMISASFSLITQAMKLHFFPRMTVIHTDKLQYGQIYVPEINYFEMIGCIIIVLVAQNSNNLTYAYGVAVCSVFVVTTIYYSMVIYVNFNRHWFWAVLFFCAFMLVDVSYLSANLLKFTTGGWFPIVMGVVLTLIMCLWRWGRLAMIKRQATISIADADLFKIKKSASFSVVQSETEMTGAPGTGDNSTMVTVPQTTILCYSSVPDQVPAAFAHFLRRLPFRPQTLIFVTLTPVNVPRVTDDLFISSVLDYPGVYRAVSNYGYMELPPPALQLAARIIRKLPQIVPANVDVNSATDAELLAALDPTFLLGRDSIEADKNNNIFRKILIWSFSYLLTLSRNASAMFGVPPQYLLEIGLRVPI